MATNDDSGPLPREGLCRIERGAAFLGLSRAKLYQLIHDGRFPSVAIDRCRRVRCADLHAFAEGRMAL